MKTAVIHNYKDNWFSANANGAAPIGTNELINYFVMSGKSSRYGCWGATEDINHIQNLSNAPKYDALCTLTGMCGNEPLITLTTPSNNATLGLNISTNISATASDPDGQVKKVEFFIGSSLIGTDSISPYSLSWTPTQLGITTVLAKAIDNDGKFKITDPHVVQVINYPSLVTSIDSTFQMTLSPIPAQDFITIQMSHITKPNDIIEIKDVLGKVIYHKTLQNQNLNVDISHLQAGLYFMTYFTNNQQQTQKFIKTH
jgi:hypothetical protein